MKQYSFVRAIEKRLLERLCRLDYPLGLTVRVLAKITQLRGEIALENNIETID